MKGFRAALVASALAPASAFGAWEAPQTLVQGVSGGAPVLAVAGNGDALAVWYTNAAAVGAVRAASARRFGTSTVISRGGSPDRLALAAGADGRAAAVWEFRAGRGDGVWLAERPAGGRWRRGAGVTELGASARWPGIGVEPAGALLATYWNGGPAVAAIRPAGGPFGAPTTLSAPGERADDPRLVSGPGGDRLVLWGQLSPSGKSLRSSSRAAGAAFGVAETVPGPGALFSGESVGGALGPAGQALVVQIRTEAARRTVVVTERPAAGVWAPPVILRESTNAFGMAAPQAAIDPAGNAVAAWVRFDGAHWVVEASERATGSGAWSPPAVLSPASRDASRPALAVSFAGRAIAAWQEKRGSAVLLRARARANPGASFGAPVTVGTSGPRRRGVPYQVASSAPRIAFGPRSRAVAVWASCFRGRLSSGAFGRSCLVQASSEK